MTLSENEINKLSKYINKLFIDTFYKDYCNSKLLRNNTFLVKNPMYQQQLKEQVQKFERIFYVVNTQVAKSKIEIPAGVKHINWNKFFWYYYTEKSLKDYIYSSIVSILKKLEYFEKVIDKILKNESKDLTKNELLKFRNFLSDILLKYNLGIQENNGEYKLVNKNQDIIHISEFKYLSGYNDLIFHLEQKRYKDTVSNARTCFEEFIQKSLIKLNKEVKKDNKKDFETLLSEIKIHCENFNNEISESVNKILLETAKIRGKCSSAHFSGNINENIALLEINSIFTCLFYLDNFVKKIMKYKLKEGKS
ncbi:hypothetical protein JCM16776_0649 [Leptotrichia shahii]|uniref:Uncharacterized protein n=1 Tax=Leptotrichia shahii TaxID=157691 RepID=A0A510JM61_9FUSO|nr:hypothetical protein [Leptotrichia shahii]BBM40429.1 hypothetical protein JCM16776_0649 [Leptotrichia shahii]